MSPRQPAREPKRTTTAFPLCGRFLQADPLGYEDSPNLYAYVLNDPVNFVDPLGLCARSETDIIICGKRDEQPRGAGIMFGTFGGLANGAAPSSSFGERAQPLHSDFYQPEIVIRANRKPRQPVRSVIRGQWRDFVRGVKSVVCSLPTLSPGGGADMYAGAGGSLGGGLNLDFAKGRFGISAYAGVGVGTGVDVGGNLGFGPSGGGIVSANLAASGGFAAPTPVPGFNLGASGTYNLLGTDPGFSGGGIGRVGTPLVYGNIGANIGLSTPSLYRC